MRWLLAIACVAAFLGCGATQELCTASGGSWTLTVADVLPDATFVEVCVAVNTEERGCVAVGEPLPGAFEDGQEINLYAFDTRSSYPKRIGVAWIHGNLSEVACSGEFALSAGEDATLVVQRTRLPSK